MTSHLQPADRMAALPPNFYHALNQRLARLKAAGRDVIRMDMGSPDLPPAPFILDALRQSAEHPDHHGYQPFGGIPEYRAAWAEFYGRRFGVELDPDTEVLGLLGSKGGIFQLALAYINPGDLVLIPDPGYHTYTAGTRFVGGEIQHLPLLRENRFLPDLEAVPADVLRRTRLMWLNYPNNPTGAVAPIELFATVVRLAHEHGFLVAHDAPYTEITYDGYRAPSLLQVPGAKDVAVEFHSLSKTANMGGWRVGVVCGNMAVLRAIAAVQSNIESGHFRPVLDAARAALTGDPAWQVERNRVYRERRDLVLTGVHAAGLTAESPAAAIYVWARLPDGVDDDRYADALLEEAGVSATPGRIFGPAGRGYLRISLGTPTARVREAMARWERWAAGPTARLSTAEPRTG